VSIRFRVTAPGSGTVTILRGDGTEVWTRRVGPFQTWEQSISWSGVDEKGEVLPNGEYTVVVSGSAEAADGASDRLRTTVQVSSAARIRYRSLWSGSSGALYAPVSGVLPAGSVQVSALAAGHAGSVEGSAVVRVPTQLAARFGLGADLELDLIGTAYLYNQSARNRYQASATLKWDAWALENAVTLRTGALLHGTLHTRTAADTLAAPDTLTDFAGISLAAPLELQIGSLRWLLAPELHWGPAAVSYGVPTPEDEQAALWAYGRTGFLLDIDSLSLGLSAAFRTKPLAQGFQFDPPLAAGAELHWLIPETFLEVSAMLGAEISAIDDYYLMGGGGLGIIY
jgi:hypothetical protein